VKQNKGSCAVIQYFQFLSKAGNREAIKIIRTDLELDTIIISRLSLNVHNNLLISC